MINTSLSKIKVRFGGLRSNMNYKKERKIFRNAVRLYFSDFFAY